MKTSAIFLSCLLAVAEAGNIFNCTKPSANFCLGGDIILRCDGNGVGKAGRCSNNLAGYAPIGGPASCFQSSADAGDAACVKNCVVHADKPFTLPGCSPTFTEAVPTTTRPPHQPHPYQNSTLTTIVTVPTTVNPGGNPSVPVPNPPASSSSVVCVGFKCGNGPFFPQTNGTTGPLPGTAIGTGTGFSSFPAPTHNPAHGGGNNNVNNDNSNNGSPTFRVPVGPTTTAANSLPTSGAMTNKAQFILAAAGLAAAYVL